MVHLFVRRVTIVSLVIMLLSISSVFTQAVGDSLATTQEPTPAVVQGNVIVGPGAFDFTESAAGLADLSSYEATLTLSFDGTQAGKAQKWTKTYVMLTMKQPAARQLTIDKTGDISDPAPVFIAEADGAAYERRGTNSCVANAIVPGGSLAEGLEPAGFLPAVFGADPAGSETVNGVTADHYTFDERAIGQSGLAKSTGEMWIASKGGYIVKYLLTTKGGADYFGEGIEGIVTWDYELTNVNGPVTIKLPNDCPAGMVHAPLLPDATNVLSLPGVLTFDSATSLADATAFYQKQMPALGWKVATLPSLTETTAELNFTQGGQLTTIIIIVDSGTTSVQIVLGSVASVQGIYVPTEANTLVPTRTKVPTRTPVPSHTPAPTRTKVPTRTPVPSRTPTR
jgi:hypothetical protein